MCKNMPHWREEVHILALPEERSGSQTPEHSTPGTTSKTSEMVGETFLFCGPGQFPELSVLGFAGHWGGDIDSSPFPSHDGRDPREGSYNGDPHPWERRSWAAS